MIEAATSKLATMSQAAVLKKDDDQEVGIAEEIEGQRKDTFEQLMSQQVQPEDLQSVADLSLTEDSALISDLEQDIALSTTDILNNETEEGVLEAGAIESEISEQELLTQVMPTQQTSSDETVVDEAMSEGSELLNRLNQANQMLQPESLPLVSAKKSTTMLQEQLIAQNLRAQTTLDTNPVLPGQDMPFPQSEADALNADTLSDDLMMVKSMLPAGKADKISSMLAPVDRETSKEIADSVNITDLTRSIRMNDKVGATLQPQKIDTPVSQSSMGLSRERGAEQVSEKVQMMFAKNLKHVDIRLDPPELGRMQIKMTMNADNTTALHFTVTNAHSKDMLEQSLPRLREMFNQQGIQLGDTSVQQEAGQSSQQDRQFVDNDSKAKGTKNASLSADDSDAVVEEGDGMELNVDVSSNGISYYA